MWQFNDSVYFLDHDAGSFIFQVLAASFVSVGIYIKRIKDFLKVNFLKKTNQIEI
jgi:hypothetical protein